MRLIDVDNYCDKVCGYKNRCSIEQRRSCYFAKDEFALCDPAEMSDLRKWFVKNFDTNDDWYEIILKQLSDDFIIVPKGEIR